MLRKTSSVAICSQGVCPRIQSGQKLPLKNVAITLMSGLILIGSIAEAAPAKTLPSESLGNFLKREAHRIFQASDRNDDQALDQTEQDDAEARTTKAFSHYTTEHILGGPRIPAKVEEPLVANLNRVNEDDFVQMFLAKAAKHDADLRAKRLAKKNIPVKPAGGVVVVVVNSKTSKQNNPHKGGHHHQMHQLQMQPVQGQFQQPAPVPAPVASNVHPQQQMHSQHFQPAGFVGQPMLPPMQHFVPNIVPVQHMNGWATGNVGNFHPVGHMTGGGGFGGGGGGAAGNPHHSGNEKHHKHHEK